MDSLSQRKYLSAIRDLSDADLVTEIERPNHLLMDSETLGTQRIEVAYAPFDHINRDSRIVIVGITPGRQQMRNAIMEARRLLRGGKSSHEALQGAKVFASFSGPMRSNLISLLDYIGLNQALRLESTASLWSKNSHDAHFTSALRYPVFLGGENYSGYPSMTTTPFLRNQLIRWAAEEMRGLPNAIFVPLGQKVGEALRLVAKEIGCNTARILEGLPHPSGANAERIAFFLQRKPEHQLSNKVNAHSIVYARKRLLEQVRSITIS